MTLVELRALVYGLINETETTNTHFDSSVINGFLNQGMEYAAVFIEYPRKLYTVQAVDGQGSYTNPTDNLVLRTAYFGDSSIPNDLRPLIFTNEETLKTIYPSWYDQTASSKADRPEYLIQLSRTTVYVFPRPNAAGSAAGKNIMLNYNYVPAAMTSDSDSPDLPVPYHNLLPLYAAHLCYFSLGKPELATEMYNGFMKKVQSLKSAVTKESKENLSFQWGQDIDGGGWGGGVIP